MKLPVRPALPNTIMDNDAHLTRPSSTYKSGNVVQTSGATSEDRALTDALFLVIDGEFRVEVARNDGAFEIGQIGQGKWIGVVPLFSDDNTSTSRIVAIGPSRVLELKQASFWSALTESPDLVSALAREFMDQMSERARAAGELILRGLR